jgi:hypothetical protein
MQRLVAFAALVGVGLAVLYLVLQPGQLPGVAYSGVGAMFVLFAAWELARLALRKGSLLGTIPARGLLIASVTGTGVGLVLIGSSWRPDQAVWIVLSGLLLYFVWSVLELRTRGSTPSPNANRS